MKEVTTMSERFWASGHWQVKEGKAEEFIQQWKEWLSRSSENVPGFHHARLLRSLASPQQFTSISEWETAAARDAWKTSPAFREGFAASRALCDEFLGGDYDEAVIVRPTTEPS
jgi:heme-degrading monooxygenase HmoA